MAKTENRNALGELARGLSAVAARLEPKQAAVVCGQAAATLTQVMAKTTNPNDLKQLPRVLSAVLFHEDASRSVPRRQSVAAAFATFTDPTALLHAAALLQPALEPLPPPLPAQALVELLKHPFCVGEARRLVLAQLARHYGRPFADQWDFVRFAEEHKLDLDFTTPPQRPGSPDAAG
jgi:hypothetical protein